MKIELLLECRNILLTADIDNPSDQKAISISENYLLQLYKPYKEFCFKENYSCLSESEFITNILLNEGFFKKLLGFGAAAAGTAFAAHKYRQFNRGAEAMAAANGYQDEGKLSKMGKFISQSGGLIQANKNASTTSKNALTAKAQYIAADTQKDEEGNINHTAIEKQKMVGGKVNAVKNGLEVENIRKGISAVANAPKNAIESFKKGFNQEAEARKEAKEKLEAHQKMEEEQRKANEEEKRRADEAARQAALDKQAAETKARHEKEAAEAEKEKLQAEEKARSAQSAASKYGEAQPKQPEQKPVMNQATVRQANEREATATMTPEQKASYNSAKAKYGDSETLNETLATMYEDYFNFCLEHDYKILSEDEYIEQVLSLNEGFFKKLITGTAKAATLGLAAYGGYKLYQNRDQIKTNINNFRQDPNAQFQKWGQQAGDLKNRAMDRATNLYNSARQGFGNFATGFNSQNPNNSNAGVREATPPPQQNGQQQATPTQTQQNGQQQATPTQTQQSQSGNNQKNKKKGKKSQTPTQQTQPAPQQNAQTQQTQPAPQQNSQTQQTQPAPPQERAAASKTPKENQQPSNSVNDKYVFHNKKINDDDVYIQGKGFISRAIAEKNPNLKNILPQAKDLIQPKSIPTEEIKQGQTQAAQAQTQAAQAQTVQQPQQNNLETISTKETSRNALSKNIERYVPKNFTGTKIFTINKKGGTVSYKYTFENGKVKGSSPLKEEFIFMLNESLNENSDFLVEYAKLNYDRTDFKNRKIFNDINLLEDLYSDGYISYDEFYNFMEEYKDEIYFNYFTDYIDEHWYISKALNEPLTPSIRMPQGKFL